MSLVDQYLDLVNCQLPEAAKHDRRYPVRFNHCFARIILDTLCGGEWYQFIPKPAYKTMTERQLQAAIAIGHQFLATPQTCVEANQASLRYRGKGQ